MEDKFGFTKDIQNWHNHRPLMFVALMNTSGPVLELGCGDGSTHMLHSFCEHTNRYLASWDHNPEWTNAFAHYASPLHKIICSNGDWDNANIDTPPNGGKWSAILVDHAPGERRKIDIERLSNKTEIMIVHDTEPAADHGYQMSKPLSMFKYRVDFTSIGAWATMVSNFIDIRQFVGKPPLDMPNIK